jgi:hypothetical protein
MPIYGYQRDDEDATKPMVLAEVTFHFSPAELRRIARFLVTRAEEIEAGKFTEGGRHLGLEDRTWDAKTTGDVIVVPPAAISYSRRALQLATRT